ncbi:MAG: DegT/DnrJ/EryC1/StrS family aminotransferase [Planctomycetota bacterium]
MAFHEWFYSLPLLNVDWGCGELGAALEAVLTLKSRSTKPVQRLEYEVRRLTGAVEAIGFERGRSALKWILEYAATRPEANGRSQVIIPALLCHAVPEAIRSARLEVVLCDITENLHMDPKSAEAVFDLDKTLAVIVPHIYGIPTPLQSFMALAAQSQAIVIDDAAASLGARLNQIPLGLHGHAGLYSFSQGKAATAGGGGMIVLPEGSPLAGSLHNRPAIFPASQAQARRRFRRFLWNDVMHRFSDPLETLMDIAAAHLRIPKRRGDAQPIENQRMAGLQAHVALAQLRRLDSLLGRRLDNIRLLRDELQQIPGLRLIDFPDEAVPTRFIVETLEHAVERESAGIRVENPLVTHLRGMGIEARYAYLPLHKYSGEHSAGLPDPGMADRLGRHLVLLPFLPPLGRGDMARIGKAVRSFFGR